MHNIADVAEFLKEVFGPDYSGCCIFANLHPPFHTRKLSELDASRDCYWSIAAFPPEAKTNLGNDALHTVALVIDDVGTKVPEGAVELALGRPTAIIRTSAGNHQWVYRLTRPVALSDWPGFFAGVEALIGHKLEARGAQTLVRLPMGRNTKKGRDNFEVALIELNGEVALDPDTIPRVRVAAAAEFSGGGTIPLKDPGKLVALVPNDDTVDRHAWGVMAHRIWALTAGSEEGFDSFDAWSQPHPTYDAQKTRTYWDSIHGAVTTGRELLVAAQAADPDGYDRLMGREAAEAFPDDPAPDPFDGSGRYEPTHVGMAEYVVRREAGELGWMDTAAERWLLFCPVERRWLVSGTDTFMRAAVRLEVERRLAVGVDAKLAARMKEAKWRGAVCGLLNKERRLMLDMKAFDTDLNAVGMRGRVLCINGQGAIDDRPGKPRDRITKTLGVSLPATLAPSLPRKWDSMAPIWSGFLHDFCGGDAELKRWWQAFCGYCLTGHTTEEIVVFVYGPGGNGKSVFLDMIGEVMGDYHKRADHRLFMEKRGGFHLAPLADLEGARLVTVPDVRPGDAWDMGLVKLVSGGGYVTANKMRQDPFQYKPQFKIVLAGNDKPRLDTVDDGVRRRMRLVPATFKPLVADPELRSKLRAEMPQILYWMVEGWGRWANTRLPACIAIDTATGTYLDVADVWGRWLVDAIRLTGNLKDKVRIAEAWQSWDAFRHGEGAHHTPPNRLQEVSSRLSGELPEGKYVIGRDKHGAFIEGAVLQAVAADVF